MSRIGIGRVSGGGKRVLFDLCGIFCFVLVFGCFFVYAYGSCYVFFFRRLFEF